MSLRGVHVMFITVSALLAIFCAGWAATAYRADQGGGYLAGAVLAFATAGALATYGRAFLRKTRRLS
jgi:hypothetical protein